MNILFVYGTLRKGESGSGLLKNSEFIGFDRVKGFIMLDFGDYPMIFESGNDYHIKVEIYRVDEYTLEQIDLFEEYYGDGSAGNLYTRKTVESLSGKWGFIYIGENIDLYRNISIIVSGDWLNKTYK